jgi:hypothetical protein
MEGQRRARTGLVNERERETGTLGSPTGGTRQRGRQGQADRDPERAHRARRGGHRFGASDQVAHCAYGPLLWLADDCADGKGTTSRQLH